LGSLKSICPTTQPGPNAFGVGPHGFFLWNALPRLLRRADGKPYGKRQNLRAASFCSHISSFRNLLMILRQCTSLFGSPTNGSADRGRFLWPDTAGQHWYGKSKGLYMAFRGKNDCHHCLLRAGPRSRPRRDSLSAEEDVRTQPTVQCRVEPH